MTKEEEVSAEQLLTNVAAERAEKEAQERHYALSTKLTQRWKEPALRQEMQSKQSKGQLASWADAQKKEARLKARDVHAQSLGFRDNGHMVGLLIMRKSAARCGVSIDDYCKLSPHERYKLRAASGAIKRRGKK